MDIASLESEYWLCAAIVILTYKVEPGAIEGDCK